MTCTITISASGLYLAAADTRLIIRDIEGHETKVDGPFEQILELKSGHYLTLPTQFRKIRLIKGSWFAGTGNFLSTQFAFERLSTTTRAEESLKSVWERERHSLREKACSETGFAPDDVERTVLFMANPAETDGVTMFNLAFASEAHHLVGDYAISWPPDIPSNIKRNCEAEFNTTICSAISKFDIAGVIRGVLKLMQAATAHSPSVGPNVQIGLAQARAGNNVIYLYGEGETTVLYGLPDVELAEIFFNVS